VVGTIATGAYPNTLAYDPANDNLYFGLQTYDEVGVVKASTDVVQRTVGIGFEPLSMAADPITGDLFVTGSNSTGTAFLAVISGSNGTVDTKFTFGANRFPVAGPDGITYVPANGDFYVPSIVGGSPGGTRGNLTIVNGTHPKVLSTASLTFNPDGIAYSSANGDLYLGNASGHNLSVYNPSTKRVVTKVQLPNTPSLLTYGASPSRVYVAIDGNVSVVSTASEKVVKSFPVTRQPDGLAVDSKTGDLYISDYVDNNVSVVNTTSYKVVASTLLGASPYDMAYDPANGRLYLGDLESSQLIVVNATTDRVLGYVPLGTTPYGIAYDPLTKDIYVDDYYPGNVSIVSGTSDKVVGHLPAGTNPWGIAYDGADHNLYVTNPGSNNITVLNPGTKKVVRSLAFTTSPGAIAFDAKSSTLFVGEYDVGSVLVLNATTDHVIHNSTTGSEPYTVSVDPGTGRAFVGNYASDNVTVLGPKGQELGKSVAVGAGVFGSAYDPVDGDVYVASFGSDLVSVINSTSVTGIGGYTSGTGPVAVTADPVSGAVFVTNYDSGSLTVLTRSPVAPLYSVTFQQTGVPKGKFWSVAFDGTLKTTGAASLAFQVANGTYSYLVLCPNDLPVSGFPPAGNITVHGAHVVESMKFVHGKTYSITLREGGLAAGESWCVRVDGDKLCSSSGSIIVKNVSNGTYRFVVQPVPGFTATPALGYLRVKGPDTGLMIRFQ
jgi:YVTN family beta-propeller protein